MSNLLTFNHKRLIREWAHQKTLGKDVYISGITLGTVLVSLLDEIESLIDENHKLHDRVVDEAILVNSWMHKYDKLLGEIQKRPEWLAQLLSEASERK